MTQIFFTSPGAAVSGGGDIFYFPNPGNWGPVGSKVECIGGGARSSSGVSGGLARGGGGGGGGAYAVRTGFTPAAWPVPYHCPPEQSYSGGYAYTGWEDTNNALTNPSTQTPTNCFARTGTASLQGYNIGLGGTDFWPAGFPGGNGGSCPSNSPLREGEAEPRSLNDRGGGGGGSAGPHGAGNAGQNSPGGGSANETAGGSGDGGTVPGGLPGNPGVSGTQFDATHGCGGGGGCRSNVAGSGTVGGGGQYGGGGGGGTGQSGITTGCYGTVGLIVLTYTPFIPPAGGAAIMMM